MGRFSDIVSKLFADQDENYQRNQMQTYMIAPEWRNVDMANEFAQFTATQKRPFYQFPYFYQVLDFWKIVKNSVKAAREQGTPWRTLLLSDVFVMDVFVGTFTTVEYLTKGLLSLPARGLAYLFGHRQNNTPTQQVLGNFFSDYAAFIHHTPFYNYAYTHWVKSLWSAFLNGPERSLDDVFSLLYFTVELPLRALIASPIAWFYNQDSNKALETIDVLIKKRQQNVTEDAFYEQTQHTLQQSLEQLRSANPALPPEQFVVLGSEHAEIDYDSHRFTAPQRQDGNGLIAIRPSNSTKPAKANTHYAYAMVRLPRYEPLKSSIEALAQDGFEVQKIAGQNRVQIKCAVTASPADDTYHAALQQLLAVEGVTELYHYQNHISPQFTYLMLDVLTNQLSIFLTRVKDNIDNVEVKLVHYL